VVVGGFTWDELPQIEPPDFRMDIVISRLKSAGDKWRDMLAAKKHLHAKR
jgi:DNA primase